MNRRAPGGGAHSATSERLRKVIKVGEFDARPTRVLVCEDNPAMRSALCELIASVPTLQLVGSAGDAASAAAQALDTAPEAVVIDVRIPGGGANAARLIREHRPEVRLVAFSAHADRDAVLAMVQAGVDEYLVKGIDDDELVDAIGQHGRGRIRLPEEALQELLFDLAQLLAEAQARLALVDMRRGALGAGRSVIQR